MKLPCNCLPTMRRRARRLAYAAMLTLTASAAPPASAAQERSDPAAGKGLAQAVCANCHLVAEGQRQAPMDSLPSFDAVANDPAMTDARLRSFLNRPHPPMPNIELSRQQIEDLVGYLVSLRRARSPAAR